MGHKKPPLELLSQFNGGSRSRNTNLYYALNSQLNSQGEIGTIRELAFLQMTRNSGWDVFHSKQADFVVDQITYEIGGKNKTKTQIKNIQDALLVKDDIVSASKGIIPLCYFGLLY